MGWRAQRETEAAVPGTPGFNFRQQGLPLQEAEAGGLLESRVQGQPGQHSKAASLRKRRTPARLPDAVRAVVSMQSLGVDGNPGP